MILKRVGGEVVVPTGEAREALKGPSQGRRSEATESEASLYWERKLKQASQGGSAPKPPTGDKS